MIKKLVARYSLIYRSFAGKTTSNNRYISTNNALLVDIFYQ